MRPPPVSGFCGFWEEAVRLGEANVGRSVGILIKLMSTGWRAVSSITSTRGGVSALIWRLLFCFGKLLPHIRGVVFLILIRMHRDESEIEFSSKYM